ncbi:MAG TPA: hypothetical protein PKC45_10940, partial [Gemmatales bacterium]|nr:hypothetical protein [Gemmatales bacterium]
MSTLNDQDRHTLARWRLVLGREAEQHGIDTGNDAECQRIEELVGFLFEPSVKSGTGSSRSGGAGGASGNELTVPQWVDAVADLFPRSAKEVLERELVQRRGIRELLEKPEILEKVEPNLELVKTLLTHRDLLSPKTRVLARKIIAKVVEELKRKMQVQVETALT